MSQKKTYLWIEALGLSSSNFDKLPVGEDPLVWGLKNMIINEEEYLKWATETYKLPAIKAEFFSMAVDFSLMAKYPEIYEWNAYCYPIYMWENVIYVACLKPHEFQSNQKICQVIAPFHPLESAWQKYQNSLPGVNTNEETIEEVSLSAENPLMTEEPKADSSSVLQEAAVEAQPLQSTETPSAPEAPTVEPIVEAQPAQQEVKTEVPPVQQEPQIETPKVENIEAAPVVAEATPTTEENASDKPLMGEHQQMDTEPTSDPVQEPPLEAKAPDSEKPAPAEISINDTDAPEVDYNSIAGIDFSNVMDDSAESPTADKKEEAPEATKDASEITHTEIHKDDSPVRTATETIHLHSDDATYQALPNMDFGDVGIENLNLEGDPENTKETVLEETKETVLEETKESQININVPPPIATESGNPITSEVKIEAAPEVPSIPEAPAPVEMKSETEPGLPSLDDLLAENKGEAPKPAPGLEKHPELKIPESKEEDVVLNTVSARSEAVTQETDIQPEVPAPPSLGTPDLPDLSNLDPNSAPAVAETPAAPETPEIPAVPEAPVAIDTPEIPTAPEVAAEAPAATTSDLPVLVNTEEQANEEVFDDDKTPPPTISYPIIKNPLPSDQTTSEEPITAEQPYNDGNTMSGAAIPIMIPDINKIADGDFAAVSDVEKAGNQKGVVTHFFSHLKRDYQKLMWVEKSGPDQYVPKYVYGDWKMSEVSWKMPVNLTHPNIFRIPFQSGQPFHGKIYDNPYNSKYIELWCRGRKPKFITIYPISINEEIISFVVGFEKNDDFDSVGSLKKIENLISICKKAFEKNLPAKAA